MPKLLTLVAKTDPILREVMPDECDFKNPVLTNAIHDMCYSILPEQLEAAGTAHNSAAGMAANQWGLKRRIFIFTPDGSGANNKLEVMLNPSYTPCLREHETEFKLTSAYEGCFSIPLTVGIVSRYDAIMAVYDAPDGTRMERLMEGWEARVFQHETDHLDGKLYDGKLDDYSGPECLDRFVFNDEQEMTEWLANERGRRLS